MDHSKGFYLPSLFLQVVPCGHEARERVRRVLRRAEEGARQATQRLIMLSLLVNFRFYTRGRIIRPDG